VTTVSRGSADRGGGGTSHGGAARDEREGERVAVGRRDGGWTEGALKVRGGEGARASERHRWRMDGSGWRGAGRGNGLEEDGSGNGDGARYTSRGYI